MTILDEIVEYKQSFIAERKQVLPIEALKDRCENLSPCRGFRANLDEVSVAKAGVIAEIKRGSPSLGCIRPDMDAVAQAAAYEAGGAAAISCLTDEKYFFGLDCWFLVERSGSDRDLSI